MSVVMLMVVYGPLASHTFSFASLPTMSTVLKNGARMWGGAQLAKHYEKRPLHHNQYKGHQSDSSLSMFLSVPSHLSPPATHNHQPTESPLSVRTAPPSATGTAAPCTSPLAADKQSLPLRKLIRNAMSKSATSSPSLAPSTPLTSVEQLRDVYGRRQHWWGDLDPVETRQLYHMLLPTYLTEQHDIPLYERARMAAEARHAARIYARERGTIPVMVSSALFDGVRHWKKTGQWSADGMSVDEVWQKYANQLDIPTAQSLDEYRDHQELCHTVLHKSCTTNQYVNALADNLKQKQQCSPLERHIAKSAKRSRVHLRRLQNTVRNKGKQDQRMLRTIFVYMRRRNPVHQLVGFA